MITQGMEQALCGHQSQLTTHRAKTQGVSPLIIVDCYQNFHLEPQYIPRWLTLVSSQS